MNVKRTAIRQHQARIDGASKGPARALDTPTEGWIATMRNALGISAMQLAEMMGQSRGNIYKTERAEVSEGASLKSIRAAAEAMDCKFVYAIVPKEGDVAELIEARARKKARAIVQKAATHMALEKQSLRSEQDAAEIERLTAEFVRDMPSDLWSDL
ncbi:MAG: mobile mystery protein A [Pseudomonadota bacterium]